MRWSRTRKHSMGPMPTKFGTRSCSEMPVSPAILNPKINPVASDVIMKALAKDPAERYQNVAENWRMIWKGAAKALERRQRKPKRPKPPVVHRRDEGGRMPRNLQLAPKHLPRSVRGRLRRPQGLSIEAAPSLPSELETSWTPTLTGRRAQTSGRSGCRLEFAGRFPRPNQHSIQVRQFAHFGDETIGRSASPTAKPSAVLDEPATEKPRIAVDPMMAENAGALKQPRQLFRNGASCRRSKRCTSRRLAPKPRSSEVDEPLPSIILRRTEPEKPRIQPGKLPKRPQGNQEHSAAVHDVFAICGGSAHLFVGVLVFWRSHVAEYRRGRPRTMLQLLRRTDACAGAIAGSCPAAIESPHKLPEAVSLNRLPPSQFLPGCRPARAQYWKKKKAPAPSAATIPGQLAVDSTPKAHNSRSMAAPIQTGSRPTRSPDFRPDRTRWS